MKRLACMLCAVLLGAAAASADLAEDVIAAYQATGRYAADVVYTTTVDQGRWKRSERTTVHLAFDRAAQKLSVDRPNIRLVADGQNLRMAVAQVPGLYVQQPIPRRPMDYAVLGEVLPALEEPSFPDLVLLLAQDPWARLGKGPRPTLRQLPDDADGNRRLDIVGPMGTMALTIDPQTLRITRGVYEFDAAANNLADGVSMRETFLIEEKTPHAELPADAFAFDTTGRQAVDHAEALTRLPAPHEVPPAQAQAQPGAHRLIGQPVPAVTFTDADGNVFDPAKAPAKVLVLDFWAQWCGPCRVWMPRLDAIYQQAQAQQQDVAIYAVSVNDDAEADRRAHAAGNFRMPLLLVSDPQATAQGYGEAMPGQATGTMPQFSLALPTTVVIHDGKIVAVHVGVGPDTERELREQIDALLAQ